MERRGFIGKFAKVVAGAALSAESLLNKRTFGDSQRRDFPIFTKVFDETVLNENGDIDSATLKIMLRKGLESLFPEIPASDFIATLFPGLTADSSIGLKLFGIPELQLQTGVLSSCLVEVLNDFQSESDKVEHLSFIAWERQKIDPLKIGFDDSVKEKVPLQFAVDENIDHDIEKTTELEKMTLTPYPHLTRICRYQIGLVSSGIDIKGKNPCRDTYLSCFRCAEIQDFPESVEESDLKDVFEKVFYPLGMKFRLFILDRLLSENTIIISAEGLFIDDLYRTKEDYEKDIPVKLTEIDNPSAPVIAISSIKRRGDDNEIYWEDTEYVGKYQIYRGETENFTPAKKLLIGITRRTKYIDYGGAKMEKPYYRITRKWGR